MNHRASPLFPHLGRPPSPAPPTAVAEATAAIATVVRGKPEVIRLALVALLAEGHILIEDPPGLGKTTLARTLSVVLGLATRRIQFTSDLLPSDVTGVSIYDPSLQSFVFREGPIFTNVLLGDEINRAGPRTQSALLEAMCEGTVTADRETRPLPLPFLVIATQNPIEHHGTYPLPDSELDRFLLRIRMGYPSPDTERTILMDRQCSDPLDDLESVLSRRDVVELCDQARSVSCQSNIVDYLLAVVAATRDHPDIELGVSPRGSLMWLRASQALAFLEGRDYVLPDDLKVLAIPVLAHRIVLRPGASNGPHAADQLIAGILTQVPVPL